MSLALRYPRRPAGAAFLATSVLASIALGLAVVRWPGLSVGAVFGALIAYAALVQPLWLIGLMLGLGALDLSFATGGFKALLPQAGGLDMNGIRLVAITMGLILVLLTIRQVRAQALSAPGRWYALFLLWAAASLAVSFAPLEGLRLLFKIAYPFLTFVVVAGLVESRRQLRMLTLITLVCGVAFVVAVNPLFVLGGGYEVDHLGFRRIRGLGMHENPFSFYLFVLLLLCFARFLVRAQWRYLAICAVLGFWIVMTLTRITLGACFLGLGAITAFVVIDSRNYRAAVAGIVLACGLGIALIPQLLRRTFGYVPNALELVSLARSPVALYESMNWQGRELLWAVLWTSLRADPLTGHGLGSSSAVLKENFPPSMPQVAHNEYLRLAVDTGLIGVALFFAAVLVWFIWMCRLGWRAPPLVREYALPALGAILGWALIAFTDNAFDYYAPFTQYIGFLCGGAVAAARICARESEPAAA